MSDSLTLASLPVNLTWKNQPLKSTSDSKLSQISITTGPQTDWFIHPTGESVKANAPIALFMPPDSTFQLQAKVTVDFADTYDAGTIFIYGHDTLWAKLCFEYSPQAQPMVVSVVTREVSDDCNSVPIEERAVYLRLYRQERVFAFHYSRDGQYWHFVRHFSLGDLEQVSVGFSAQSPLGEGCNVFFSEIRYILSPLLDLRSGE